MSKIVNIKPVQRPPTQKPANFETKTRTAEKSKDTKKPKRASIPLFSKHGRASVIGKTKGWLPYAIKRLSQRTETNAVAEPSASDLEILSKFGFDETMLRLSRLRIALGRTDFAKTDEGIAAMRRIDLHIGAMYIAAQQIEASYK